MSAGQARHKVESALWYLGILSVALIVVTALSPSSRNDLLAAAGIAVLVVIARGGRDS